MAAVEINRGDVEPIWVAYYLNAAAVTGSSTIVFAVRRTSDDKILDFADMAFKTSPGTATSALTETPASSGFYEGSLDTSAFTNAVAAGTPESYIVTISDTSGAGTVLEQHELRIRAVAALPAAVWAVSTRTLSAGAITNGTFAAGAVDATALADGAITAAKIASNAITNAKIAAGAIAAASFASGAIDASAFAQGAADKAWSTASRTLTAATNLGALASQSSVDALASAVAAIPSPLDAAATAAAVWNALTASYVGAGSFGALLGTNINATISSRAATGAAMTLAANAVTSAALAASGISAIQAAILSDATPFAGAAIAAIAGGVAALPSSSTISAQVASDLATAHGVGAWTTANVASLATASALATAQADLTAIKGAGFTTGDDLHSIKAATGGSSAPDAATIAAAVWAASEGSPTVGTMGWALWTLRMGATNKMSIATPGTLTLYRDDSTTAHLTWSGIRDGAGSPIQLPSGAPAIRLKAA